MEQIYRQSASSKIAHRSASRKSR